MRDVITNLYSCAIRPMHLVLIDIHVVILCSRIAGMNVCMIWLTEFSLA